MSNELAKYLNSRRRFKDEAAIKKQTKIVKAHGFPTGPEHRLAKVHAMTCGDPNCVMCMNPRKSFNELTQQEKRLFQDVENTRNRRSNGTLPEEE